ncbi:PREDICTED: protein virilizer-like [Priapulus caudatus]|uniref:Protein virilizer-like n=1 Tax=Priapulus caudatus TaxID=37621 RepID=A0ABM1EIH8_PRICU|nr:PREDICTED: protein virilizer-like [Priapulus caudatus]
MECGDDENAVELLFFDTFTHEKQDLNLDLVQFPHPVNIHEVRVIPLGSRVKADFPGGYRLGATNPSAFVLDMFINNLSCPGAASFERFGRLQIVLNADCTKMQTADADCTKCRLQIALNADCR